jgi:integrase
LTAAGVGDAATRKALLVLQSMLERAVEWQRIDSNPAKLIRKPSRLVQRVVRPLPPGEALGLRWYDVGERTILIERSVAFGKLKSTKTGKTRTVRLLAPLSETLEEWRRATDRTRQPTSSSLRPTGRPGTGTAPITGATAGSPTRATPRASPACAYDLRHSFVSLLVAQGATVVEVAQQAGHSPTMALSTYAHLFDEHDADRTTSADDLIHAARAGQQCPASVRFVSASGRSASLWITKPLQIRSGRSRTRTWDLFLIREAL